jgi:hypothetical protein
MIIFTKILLFCTQIAGESTAHQIIGKYEPKVGLLQEHEPKAQF